MSDKKQYESPEVDFEKLRGSGKTDIFLASGVDTGDGLEVDGYDFGEGRWW